MFLIPCMFS